MRKKKLTDKLESEVVDAFRDKTKLRHPGRFWYKIPDTLNIGGKKPFDAILLVSGWWFCLEFKRGKDYEPTDLQAHFLNLASKNGAISRLVNEENTNDILEEIYELVHGRMSLKDTERYYVSRDSDCRAS